MNHRRALLFRRQGRVAAASVGGLCGVFLYEGRHYVMEERSAGEFNHWRDDRGGLVGFHLSQVDFLYPELLASRLVLETDNVITESGDLHILLGAASLENITNDTAQLVDVSVYADGKNDHLLSVPLIPRMQGVLWSHLAFSFAAGKTPVPAEM